MKSNITVGVVDYGVGNIRSVESAILHLDAKPILSSDHEILLACDRIILPGVGAFGHGITELQKRGLIQTLRQAAIIEKPILGICLGMQLLTNGSSEFGQWDGIGLLSGLVTGLETQSNEVKTLPHVAWRNLFLEDVPGYSWLFDGLNREDRFYFIHSYAVDENSNHVVATTTYQGAKFSAILAHGQTVGVQFHPEKSGRAGLRLLKNFIWRGA